MKNFFLWLLGESICFEISIKILDASLPTLLQAVLIMLVSTFCGLAVALSLGYRNWSQIRSLKFALRTILYAAIMIVVTYSPALPQSCLIVGSAVILAEVIFAMKPDSKLEAV